jgi:hypothetical protein
MAREKFATALPLEVYFNSESDPVLPIRMTLLMPISGIFFDSFLCCEILSSASLGLTPELRNLDEGQGF